MGHAAWEQAAQWTYTRRAERILALVRNVQQ